MPIHFNPNETITVDTVEEAIRFEQLRRSGVPPKKASKKPKTRNVRQGWEGFVERVDGPENVTARKVLALVAGDADGLDRRRLADQLELDIMVVTGTITGIRKKASAAGLNPDDVITKDPQDRYRPGRLLAQHGAPMP